MNGIAPSRRATYLRTCRVLATLSSISAAVYLFWLLFVARPDNTVLFVLLISAEVFNIIQAAGFWYTIWDQKWTEPAVPDFTHTSETVDVFITVYGEPVEIVAKTLEGAMRIRHPRMSVWILDDGPSTDIQALATIHSAGYLTRPDRRGAKAGNMNEALKRTSGEYVVILDADHVPEPEFLEKTLGGFRDEKVAFVQTPQYYENRLTNRVSAGAHEQQGLFYGAILRGKSARGAVFSCGTNVVFRRSALAAVGNMPEDSITEDLRVSLILSQAGYTALYVPTVLAYGMGPLDVGGYFSQQARWARGGLEILFKRHPYFHGIPWGQAIQYSLGFLYWFTGFSYVSYLVLPVAYLAFGLRPVQVPNQYPVFFVPYFVLTLLTLAFASDFRMTYRGVWFTLASFPAFIGAFASSIFGRRARFVVTSKERSSRSLRPVRVHVFVIVALVAVSIYGMARAGTGPSVMNNVAFALGHILILQGFVRYALNPEGRAWLEDADLSEPALQDLVKESS